MNEPISNYLFTQGILGVAGIVILTSGAHATDLTGCRVN